MFLLIKNRNETGNENVGGGKEVEVNQRSLNQSDQLPSVFILAKSFATTFQCGVCVYCFRVCYSIYLFVWYNIVYFFLVRYFLPCSIYAILWFTGQNMDFVCMFCGVVWMFGSGQQRVQHRSIG